MGQSRKSVRKPRHVTPGSPIKYSAVVNGMNIYAAIKREDEGWEYAIERQFGGEIETTRSLVTLASWVYPASDQDLLRKQLICEVRKAINC